MVLSRPRGLLWHTVQVPAKICEGLLPASRFVACACAGAAAKQPIRSITVAKMSARFNILLVLQNGEGNHCQHPDYGTGGDGHLLADYPANGSAHMTQGRERDISEYPLCVQRT